MVHAVDRHQPGRAGGGRGSTEAGGNHNRNP
jgi:hypothetical protein